MASEELPLRRVIYTSQAAAGLTRDGLLRVLYGARQFNALNGVTGMLWHANGRFVQVLEGVAAAVEDALERIHSDPHHEGMALVIDMPIDRRGFRDWDMALIEEGFPDDLGPSSLSSARGD